MWLLYSPYNQSVARIFSFCVLLALSLATPRGAFAQDEQDTAAARTLFHEGIACVDADDHVCAADRFRRSNELRPSPIVAFNLAGSEAEVGRLVVASELYRMVLRTTDGELAEAAQSALDVIVPRLAQVTVIVDTTAQVLLDGSEMQAAMHGVAIPLDPGEHQLRALYGAQLAAEDTFTVGEGQSITHAFEVPLPEANLAVEGIPADPAAEGPLTATPPEEDHTTRRVLGVTLGIVAAAGVAVLLALLLRPSAPDPTDTTLPPIIFD